MCSVGRDERKGRGGREVELVGGEGGGSPNWRVWARDLGSEMLEEVSAQRSVGPKKGYDFLRAVKQDG